MDYNIFDLDYNKNLTKIDSFGDENQEMLSSFTNQVPAKLLGSIDGNDILDLGTAAWENTEDIQVDDIINDRINTAEATILADWTFGTSGAFVVGTASDGLSLSPTGILAKKAGNTTFAITSGGDATFGGDLSAATGTFSGELIAASGKLGDSTDYVEFDGTNLNIETPELSISGGNASFSGSLSSGISITSPSITGGTITSGKIQTSSSGERIVLDDTSDSLTIFDSDDYDRLALSSIGLQFKSASSTPDITSLYGTSSGLVIDNDNLSNAITITDDSFTVGNRKVQCQNGLLRVPVGTNKYE